LIQYKGNGLLLKDFGPVYPDRDVFIEFSNPIDVVGNGKKEHQIVIDFIKRREKICYARIVISISEEGDTNVFFCAHLTI